MSLKIFAVLIVYSLIACVHGEEEELIEFKEPLCGQVVESGQPLIVKWETGITTHRFAALYLRRGFGPGTFEDIVPGIAPGDFEISKNATAPLESITFDIPSNQRHGVYHIAGVFYNDTLEEVDATLSASRDFVILGEEQMESYEARELQITGPLEFPASGDKAYTFGAPLKITFNSLNPDEVVPNVDISIKGLWFGGVPNTKEFILNGDQTAQLARYTSLDKNEKSALSKNFFVYAENSYDLGMVAISKCFEMEPSLFHVDATETCFNNGDLCKINWQIPIVGIQSRIKTYSVELLSEEDPNAPNPIVLASDIKASFLEWKPSEAVQEGKYFVKVRATLTEPLEVQGTVLERVYGISGTILVETDSGEGSSGSDSNSGSSNSNALIIACVALGIAGVLLFIALAYIVRNKYKGYAPVQNAVIIPQPAAHTVQISQYSPSSQYAPSSPPAKGTVATP